MDGKAPFPQLEIRKIGDIMIPSEHTPKMTGRHATESHLSKFHFLILIISPRTLAAGHGRPLGDVSPQTTASGDFPEPEIKDVGIVFIILI